MTVDDLERVLRAWIGLWNDHALERFSQAVATEYVHHAMTGQDLDLEGFRNGFAAIVDAFPDIRYRIDHLVTGQGLAAAYLTGTGTQRGTFLGIPPSGHAVTFRGTYHCRIAEGRIIEDWDVFDLLGPALRLGASLHAPNP